MLPAKSDAQICELSIALEQEKAALLAVDKVNFHLKSGETLALLGESGCGKSLTAFSLMRLLPPIALYGLDSQILIDEQDILTLPEALMRQLRGAKLAMIFQEPMTALNPVLTIGEQLKECFRKQALSKARLKAKQMDLLKEVELPNPELLLNHYPHQLSGGQKQRVVIAMALAGNPSILIADEPTTALDVTIQAQILALLKRLQQKHNMALLLITHDLGVVKNMANTVCVMYTGQVVGYAQVDKFFAHVLHPYVYQLLHSLPGWSKRNQQLQVLKGSVPTLGHWPEGCRFHTRCAYVLDKCKHIEPELQTIDAQKVRCHLYPDLEKLPALKEEKIFWHKVNHPNPIILTINNLSVRFTFKSNPFSRDKVETKAVDNLSFQLEQGKTLAIVGESGCGKTTLARAILRLVPATQGEIIYYGQNILNISGKKLRDYRKKVQIIFQDPFSSMNPRMTVGEIIAEGMQAQGIPHQQIIKKQAMLLDQVQLPSTSLYKYPHQFSGGQRQRICIARALATDPKLIICDEPTSALDMSVQAQILNLLKTLQQDNGISYLFITHNIEVVSYLADDIIVMKAGKIVEQGDCETVLNNPQVHYTKELLSAVLSIHS